MEDTRAIPGPRRTPRSWTLDHGHVQATWTTEDTLGTTWTTEDTQSYSLDMRTPEYGPSRGHLTYTLEHEDTWSYTLDHEDTPRSYILDQRGHPDLHRGLQSTP